MEKPRREFIKKSGIVTAGITINPEGSKPSRFK
jgi:hypothetical protein